MVKRYDHPNNLVHRESGGVVAAAATSFVQQYFHQKSRIRGVHIQVLTAGTATATPADASIEFMLHGPGGTTSFANIPYTTNSVQYVAHQTVTATVAQGNSIRAAKKNDATGVVVVGWEYETMPDAVQS